MLFYAYKILLVSNCGGYYNLTFFAVIMGMHLHINYIVYKHFYRSLHVRSSDPTCVLNFKPVTLTVFEE